MNYAKSLFDTAVEAGNFRFWLMADFIKNRAPRYKVAKAGTIKFGERTVDCLVRSLSATGAGMEVVNQLGIPTRFELLIPGDGLTLSCRVVWRKDHRMGVAFTKSAD